MIVQYRTNSQVLCADCRKSRRKEQSRAGVERQRRKRGIPEIKGSVIKCQDCDADVVLNRNTKAIRCRACAVEISRQRARERSLAKRGVPGARDGHSAWYKKKRHSDPAYAINFRFRAAIRRCISNPLATSKWEAVGYKLSDLMSHLERQFLPGMTWKNRGKWEIDHIVPLTSFSFSSPEDPEFRAAWALANLRPIWAPDNRKKNQRRTHLL